MLSQSFVADKIEKGKLFFRIAEIDKPQTDRTYLKAGIVFDILAHQWQIGRLQELNDQLEFNLATRVPFNNSHGARP